MNEVMGDRIGKFVFVYLDDIVIYSDSFDDHMNHLQQTLKALGDNNLKANVIGL